MPTTPEGIVYPVNGTKLTPLATHFANLAQTADTAIRNSRTRQIGTNAERIALTAPAARNGILFYCTDTKYEWLHDGSGWKMWNTPLLAVTTGPGWSTSTVRVFMVNGVAHITGELSIGAGHTYDTLVTVPAGFAPTSTVGIGPYVLGTTGNTVNGNLRVNASGVIGLASISSGPPVPSSLFFNHFWKVN